MNNILPIPKSRKPKFPDPDKRQSDIEIRKTMQKVLFDFKASLPARKRALADLVVKFASRLLPQDRINLPYISFNGKAINPIKNECVAALISWAVEQSWACQRGEENTMQEEIEKIKKITKAGLDKYKIIGTASKYELAINS